MSSTGSSSNTFGVFKCVCAFVADLAAAFGQRDHNIQLYHHLLANLQKNKIKQKAKIEGVVAIFRSFLRKNKDLVATRRLTEFVVPYNKKVFIDLRPIVEADKRTADLIVDHLLAVKAQVDGTAAAAAATTTNALAVTSSSSSSNQDEDAAARAEFDKMRKAVDAVMDSPYAFKLFAKFRRAAERRAAPDMAMAFVESLDAADRELLQSLCEQFMGRDNVVTNVVRILLGGQFDLRDFFGHINKDGKLESIMQSMDLNSLGATALAGLMGGGQGDLASLIGGGAVGGGGGGPQDPLAGFDPAVLMGMLQGTGDGGQGMLEDMMRDLNKQTGKGRGPGGS